MNTTATLRRYPVHSVHPDGTVIRSLRKRLGIALDPHRKSPKVAEFEEKLHNKVIGQPEAVEELARAYQVYLAGMSDPTRPIQTLLFLGPTGTGKTHAVESAAEILFNSPKAMIKVDCAEFQHSHEIAKLIGSPPGFLGHRETTPILSQQKIDWFQTGETKMTVILFDEIEKGNDSLRELLLGITDKATLTLGDNQRVNFAKTIVIMTSNLGAKEMSKFLGGGIGFNSNAQKWPTKWTRNKIREIALNSLKRRFNPEFCNRIDRMVVFNTLSRDDVDLILENELINVHRRINMNEQAKFKFDCSERAKQQLVEKGFQKEYGGRRLNREIERLIVYPLANLVATEQIKTGDQIYIDWDPAKQVMVFKNLS